MTGRGALALALTSVVAFAPRPVVAAGRARPAPSPGAAIRVMKIAGDTHKLLLRADGTVAGWGLCQHGQLGPVAAIPRVRNRSTALVAIALPGKAVDIAAGATASYAVLDDGTVMAWGRANAGQLGNGEATAPLLADSTTSMEYRDIETPGSPRSCRSPPAWACRRR